VAVSRAIRIAILSGLIAAPLIPAFSYLCGNAEQCGFIPATFAQILALPGLIVLDLLDEPPSPTWRPWAILASVSMLSISILVLMIISIARVAFLLPERARFALMSQRTGFVLSVLMTATSLIVATTLFPSLVALKRQEAWPPLQSDISYTEVLLESAAAAGCPKFVTESLRSCDELTVASIRANRLNYEAALRARVTLFWFSVSIGIIGAWVARILSRHARNIAAT
jgi:hypothetical protein